MASLLKRGGTWTARIYVEGRERWRSLGTGDRAEAERKLREIEVAIKGTQWIRRQLDELIARAEQEVQPDELHLLAESFSDGLRRILAMMPAERRDALALSHSRSLTSDQSRKLAIAGGWEAWLNSANRASMPKDSTLRAYRGSWQRFEAWAGKHRVTWFHELDEAGTLAYAENLWVSKITQRTFNAHIQILRNAWNTLRTPAGLTAPNPWDSVKTKSLPADTGRRDLTPDEIRAVIGTASGSLRLLLLAGALTGARLGDIANMRWADLDLDAATWAFTPMKTSRKGKRLTLPLLDPLLGDLRASKAESVNPDVFPEDRILWQRDDLSRRISAHFESCGIVTREAAQKGQARRKARCVVGFHSLRHTAATLAAKSGANLGLVQRVLGHASRSMTAHYTHGDLESARAVLAPLADVVSLPARGQG